MEIKNLFLKEINVSDNLINIVDFNASDTTDMNQLQTKEIFSEKWVVADEYEKIDELYKFQFDWFLSLYGFETIESLVDFLKDKYVIIDAGCGLGYKAAWLAELAPHAIVIGVDISESIRVATKNYKHISNLFFLQSDIANTGIKDEVIDFTVCDQVIMHTENPEYTFKHLSKITSKTGEFACYVYSKKALPRELLDDYFRKATHQISSDSMWEFSEQITELGKRLSALNVKFESPDIPLLGIKGGEYDIQRFIYWNFIKCFWKEDWGFDLSKSTNFDWYAPSNAKRYTKDEFLQLGIDNDLTVQFFHQEEACHTARFKK
jgi:ubiquinone/menaquinone biosynthesis C-methylase UbiE